MTHVGLSLLFSKDLAPEGMKSRLPASRLSRTGKVLERQSPRGRRRWGALPGHPRGQDGTPRCCLGCAYAGSPSWGSSAQQYS